MKVVVVGCGPSAPQHAETIDACACVIRCGAFPFSWAGNRWHIWASSFTAAKCVEMAEQGMVPGNGSQPVDLVLVPPSQIWCLADHPERRFKLGRKRVLTIGKRLCSGGLKKRLGRAPSEGLQAVTVALERYPGDEIAIVGFDCLTPKVPSWTLPGDRKWAGDGGHNYPGEKKLLGEWEAEGRLEWWRLKCE